MSVTARIDDLIEAGWSVLDSGFDPLAFHRWRRRALDCLTAIVGPDHDSTRHFQHLVRQCGKIDLRLIRGGLAASEEKESDNRFAPETANANGGDRPPEEEQ
jgi:hypothetical protein